MAPCIYLLYLLYFLDIHKLNLGDPVFGGSDFIPSMMNVIDENSGSDY